MKKLLRALLPRLVRRQLKEWWGAAVNWRLNPSGDFYSPLPNRASLRQHVHRWFKPSDLAGLAYDLKGMQQLLQNLTVEYGKEYQELPPYHKIKNQGYGPGFTIVDAMTLYFMTRHLRPRRFIEIGSGLSTYYAWLAGQKNRSAGQRLRQTCIDPTPFKALSALPDLEILAQEAQDAEPGLFSELEFGDILFIDSTHVVKVDGEVPYFVLEIIPRLKPGVVIHFHDVHFPYHVPCDPEQYVFNSSYYWTEAMLVQAFLAFNPAFRIVLSTPLLRFHCEPFLRNTLPEYRPLDPQDWDTHFGSLWIQRV